MDASMDALISADASIEIIAEGHDWTEGPLWVESEKMLLYSDIPPNKIFKWTEAKGSELYLTPSGYTGSVPRKGEPGSNGLILNKEGKLVLCQHGDRRMAVMDADLKMPAPNFITLADNYQGKKLNSPNDAVFRSNGDLFFTDPPYDKKSLHLYEELGFTAHRLLKEGGSLITFVGTYDIPKILELVQKNGLKYWWVICVKHTGAHAHMMQKRVFVYWKPMLWFVKGKDIMEGLESLPDFVESKPPDKTLHKWEQSTVEAEHVINKLTIGENQIVLDPFMGSGTTGIATLHLKRKFIGIEKDPEKFEIAKRRLENESMQTL